MSVGSPLHCDWIPQFAQLDQREREIFSHSTSRSQNVPAVSPLLQVAVE